MNLLLKSLTIVLFGAVVRSKSVDEGAASWNYSIWRDVEMLLMHKSQLKLWTS